jgi:hypothetical protein
MTGASSTKGVVAGFEVPRDDVELIPEGLRIDRQSLAGHHRDLAFQRQMIRVLRDRHAHAKFRRVAAPRLDLGRPRRCDDGRITAAAVLEPDMPLDVIGELDGRDPLRGLRLAVHLIELAPTRRTLALVGRQLVANLDHRQRRLRPRSMPRCGWPLRRGRVRWRGRLVKDTRAPLLVIGQGRELELLGVQSLEPRELRSQIERLRDEALIFAIEEEADLAERFKVLFLGQLHHVRRI